MHEPMEYRVLGPLRAGAGGVLALPRGDRARDVLAVLVERRGRAVAASTLLDLVWGAGQGELTTAVLHTVVARLRRQLGDDVVQRRDDGYLVTGSCDADAFGDHVRAARAAERDGDRAARIASARAALGLWSGEEPYEGVRDDLVLGERTRLAELRRATLVDLASALVGAGTPAELAEAREITLRLRSDAALDEQVTRLFMRAAYALGRHAEAVEAFDVLRRALRDELGVAPAPATLALHELVLRHAPELQPDRPTPRGRVPAPPNPTIGREAELSGLRDALTAGRRLVTLTGPGGAGKSRLLRELGVRLEREGHDPAWAHLGGHAGLGAPGVAEVLGRALGVRAEAGDPVRALLDALRSTAGPLLLDEAEWSLDGAATVVRALLDECPRLRVVVSSRSALGVEGEVRQVVGPLPVPTEGADRSAAAGSAAVQLLAARLGDLGAAPAASLDDWPAGDLGAVVEAVRAVDGLPLGIELLAGAADLEGLRGLADLAARPLDVSAGRDDRHDSLRATIDWSLGRLSPGAAAVWRRLAVLADPFDAPVARAVTGSPEAASTVRALARDNLLHLERRADGLWLRVLRPLRERGLEALEAAGEATATRDRHRAWFADRWRGAALSEDLVLDVDRTFADHEAALDSAVAGGHVDDAVDLALTLARYWQFRESSAPGLALCDRALALPGLSRSDRARLLVASAGFARHLTWEDDDALLRDLDGDADWTASALVVLAIDRYIGGDARAALATSRQLVDWATVRAPGRAAEAWAVRAVMAASTGRDEDEARHAAAEATRLQGLEPTAVDLAAVSPKVALALLELDDPAGARRLLERSAAGLEERTRLRPASTLLINLGWAALGTDDPSAALTAFARGLGVSGVSGGGVVGEGVAGSACALALLGDPAAGELLDTGLELLRVEGELLAPRFAAHVERARSLLVEGRRAPAVVTAAGAVDRVLELAADRSG